KKISLPLLHQAELSVGGKGFRGCRKQDVFSKAYRDVLAAAPKPLPPHRQLPPRTLMQTDPNLGVQAPAAFNLLRLKSVRRPLGEGLGKGFPGRPRQDVAAEAYRDIFTASRKTLPQPLDP